MTGETMLRPTTLVLGGTGKTGRRVADRLMARGVPTRIGSRSGAPPFDWDDRATWAPALRDMEAAYISYFPDVAVPGAVETVGAFAELAVRLGVRRLVLLAGRGEPEAEQAELAVREPFVDVDHIADVAVAALTEHGHVGRLYELTGPRLLTFADAVAEIASATGRDLRYAQISIEAYSGLLREWGVPPDYVTLIEYLFTEVMDGRNALLADGVQRALGREPRDFADYARDAAAGGAWSPPFSIRSPCSGGSAR